MGHIGPGGVFYLELKRDLEVGGMEDLWLGLWRTRVVCVSVRGHRTGQRHSISGLFPSWYVSGRVDLVLSLLWYLLEWRDDVS